ncbi:Hypothetical protein CINCED_3A022965 [Cinara cedri]|uniref:Uncharacterized protein n=1 Tax=Cinara cedri TaxID=506608 RepID=A0A5E4N8U5_9HEMI|nr:Hypothetical protein CINCED_3A022965 [Cinara cedri]
MCRSSYGQNKQLSQEQLQSVVKCCRSSQMRQPVYHLLAPLAGIKFTQFFLEHYQRNDETFLELVVTRDETWVFTILSQIGSLYSDTIPITQPKISKFRF